MDGKLHTAVHACCGIISVYVMCRTFITREDTKDFTDST